MIGVPSVGDSRREFTNDLLPRFSGEGVQAYEELVQRRLFTGRVSGQV